MERLKMDKFSKAALGISIFGIVFNLIHLILIFGGI
jgi:hypothetical protein